jgi:hypothetical protein
MMAVNDLVIADHSLRQWSEAPPSSHPERAQGAKSYFVRLMIAHTFEALRIISKIKETPELKKLVPQSDANTQQAFARLTSFIGSDDYRAMKKIRDAIAFHYLKDPVVAAIERQANRFPDGPLSLSVGSKTLDWYCEPADRAVDSIIVRHAIGLTAFPVVAADVDKVASRLQTISEDVMNFSGYFIPKFCVR